MSTAPKLILTETEYLARERASSFKSEYYQGETFAMAVGTREHNLIAANIVRSLGNQLASEPCEVYTSDMKVRVNPTGLYTYPDVTVACGEPRFADEQQDVLLNPVLLVEVLSPSTAAYDCGTKATHYRQLDSLQAFLLVDANAAVVEHFRREDSDTWRVTRHEGLDTIIDLKSIGCRLSLADAYAKVRFEPGTKPLLRSVREDDS